MLVDQYGTILRDEEIRIKRPLVSHDPPVINKKMINIKKYADCSSGINIDSSMGKDNGIRKINDVDEANIREIDAQIKEYKEKIKNLERLQIDMGDNIYERGIPMSFEDLNKLARDEEAVTMKWWD